LKGAAGSTLAVLKPQPQAQVHTPFLGHFLKSKQAYLRSTCKGATVPHIDPTAVAGLEIELPDLAEQRRIAAILDQADAVRAKRRQVLKRIGQLPGAAFLQFFGDPVDNPHGWRRLRLGDVVSGIASGESPVCESRPASAGEWAVLKLGAVSYGHFNPKENKAFLGDVGTLRQVEVKPGDFLFSRKNTKELVGATVVVQEDVPSRLLLPDLIFRLGLNEGEIEADYLHGLLRNSRKRPQVVALASGSASSMSNISQGRLLGLTVEVPPIEYQRKYVHFVRGVARRRGYQERALAQLDELFVSIQSRAFAGQL
jgi:type I restriction enzyme, S subunit